jgi:hypothetical protein
MKSSDSKAKIVAQTRGFTTVQRSLAGVACTGCEIRRKSGPRHGSVTAKTATRYETDMQNEKNGRSIRPIKDLNLGRPDINRGRYQCAMCSSVKEFRLQRKITE